MKKYALPKELEEHKKKKKKRENLCWKMFIFKAAYIDKMLLLYIKTC